MRPAEGTKVSGSSALIRHSMLWPRLVRAPAPAKWHGAPVGFARPVDLEGARLSEELLTMDVGRDEPGLAFLARVLNRRVKPRPPAHHAHPPTAPARRRLDNQG